MAILQREALLPRRFAALSNVGYEEIGFARLASEGTWCGHADDEVKLQIVDM